MDETTLKEDLQKIDQVIELHKGKLEDGKKLERLMKNQDFIDLILVGYFEQEAQKLFKILTDPTGASPYAEETIRLKLASISDFRGYVGTEDYPGTIKIAAEAAPQIILKEELYRNELTASVAASEE